MMYFAVYETRVRRFLCELPEEAMSYFKSKEIPGDKLLRVFHKE